MSDRDRRTPQAGDVADAPTSPIEQKYRDLGGASSFLGMPTSAETATPDGHGRYRHYAGGSIYSTPQWGTCEVHGLIGQRWAELGWERSFLGYPVTDERALADGRRYSVFEHGAVVWTPPQATAGATGHQYERLCAATRAQILSRFFALGARGRRNHFAMMNHLAGPVPADPTEARR